MKALAILEPVKSMAGKASYILKKSSPELLIGGSIVGFMATVVLACIATKKSEPIVQTSKEELELLRSYQPSDTSEFTEQDKRQEIAKVYISTAVSLAKLYAPAIILGSLSITGVLTSNHILKKRNLALGAAYSAMDAAFKNYRKRVVDKFGEEADRELWTGTKREEIRETKTGDDGKPVEVTTYKDVQYGRPISPYARFFDESSPAWVKDSESNLTFLCQAESDANERLKAHHVLFLNEVYEMLGIPKTKAGQVVGWVYRREADKGDNRVDFGLRDVHNGKVRDFVNGYERSVLLDFNVDGDILNDRETFELYNL